MHFLSIFSLASLVIFKININAILGFFFMFLKTGFFKRNRFLPVFVMFIYIYIFVSGGVGWIFYLAPGFVYPWAILLTLTLPSVGKHNTQSPVDFRLKILSHFSFSDIIERVHWIWERNIEKACMSKLFY